MVSLVNSTKYLKNELQYFSTSSRKLKGETLPNSFSKTYVTLVPKSVKDGIRKEIYRQTSLTNISAKILNRMLAD